MNSAEKCLLISQNSVFNFDFNYDLKKIIFSRFNFNKVLCTIIYRQFSVKFKFFSRIKIGQRKLTLIVSKLKVF